ncbi:MAG TPA: GldG family protein [Polyangiaceae bacterium]
MRWPQLRWPHLRKETILAAVGVMAAAVILVCVNILVARFYRRWDVTSSRLYTLADATKVTLHSLSEPVEVAVFLGRSDPLTASVRQMLEAYGAETRHLHARFVDPDQSPAEFLALQQKYGILTGKTEDGRVVTDATLVVARGDRHWFISTDDLVEYDDQQGRARPKLEQALTEAILNVQERRRQKMCFSKGHRELSVDDSSPIGLLEFRQRLDKNNFEVESIDLSPPMAKGSLAGCQAVVVAGAQVPFDATAAAKLQTYLQQGGGLLLLLSPMLDDDNRVRSSGLEPVSKLAGIEINRDFVFEADPGARLPAGSGESFFATPKRHAVTAGLAREGDPSGFRVLASSAQSLKNLDQRAAALLVTSDQAYSVRDLRWFLQAGEAPSKKRAESRGPLVLAMAAELAKPAGSPRGPRLVVVGTASVGWSRNWRDPTLLGGRVFTESAVSWLAARPALVSVPEKPSHPIGLTLTEKSLSEVWRYVLLYMPGSAAVLGFYVMLRRRSLERRRRDRDSAQSQQEPRA